MQYLGAKNGGSCNSLIELYDRNCKGVPLPIPQNSGFILIINGLDSAVSKKAPSPNHRYYSLFHRVIERCSLL